jgi:hypothetical protein
LLGGLVPTSKDAVSAGADNAAGHYQDDPKNDLTLDQLHNSNDDQNRCNDPQNSTVHVSSTVGYRILTLHEVHANMIRSEPPGRNTGTI